MKLRVSRHVACAWTWGLEYDGTCKLKLRKSHPLWELVTEVINHLPELMGELIIDTDTFAKLDERYSADMATLEVPKELVKQLWFPLWELVDNAESDDD